MLSLTVIIALDTVRRWYVLLANGAKQPDAEPVVALAEEEQA